jgi:hypothetical protein
VGGLAERWRGLIPEPPAAGPLVDAAEAAGSAAASAIAQAAVRAAALPPMPTPRVLPASLILPPGMPDEAYVRAFLSAFGATMERPAPFRDVTGETLMIGDALFRARDGAWKIGKRDRATFVLVLAEALRQPDEVWAEFTSPTAVGSGGVILRRRYVARFLLDGAPAPALVVFEFSRKLWQGVTAFPAEDEGYLARQRRGTLMYRREGR